MRYLPVCSGIEAATAAWHPLGWVPAAFAEIDKFPSSVLAKRWPGVRNLGDFTKIESRDVGPIDVLAGGTPCQSFSVAGLRGGLDDDRGNLALEFCRLARRTRPRWILWENVPGVRSLDGGAAMRNDEERAYYLGAHMTKPFEISPVELLALHKAALVLKVLGTKMADYRSQQEAKALGEVCGEIADRYEICSALNPKGDCDR